MTWKQFIALKHTFNYTSSAKYSTPYTIGLGIFLTSLGFFRLGLFLTVAFLQVFSASIIPL